MGSVSDGRDLYDRMHRGQRSDEPLTVEAILNSQQSQAEALYRATHGDTEARRVLNEARKIEADS